MRRQARLGQKALEALRTVHGLSALETRQRVMHAVAAAAESDVAGYYEITSGATPAAFAMGKMEGVGISPAALKRLHSDFASVVAKGHLGFDPRHPGLRERRSFLETSTLASPAQLEASPILGVLSPHGLADHLRLLVYHGNRFVGWVGAFGKNRARTFAPADRNALASLVRPISAALVLAATLERGEKTLEPADLVVTSLGLVEYASEAGRAWLTLPDFTPALASWVRDFDRGRPSPLPLPAAADARIVRLDGGGAVRYLVCVRPRLAVFTAAASVLSPQQRRVAEYAVAGATVVEISRAMGITYETARGHLKACYERLEVANRLELARALQAEDSSKPN